MSELKFVNILDTEDALKNKVRGWRNSSEVRKFMLTRHTISKEEHAKWINSLRMKNEQKFWIVFADNIPIGSANFQNINESELSAEWGFYIAEIPYRGKGLGQCMLLRLLEIFFDEMKFETLYTKTTSLNLIALNLYRKFKFREVGRGPFKSGEDIVKLEFSSEDWKRCKEELRNECKHKIAK